MLQLQHALTSQAIGKLLDAPVTGASDALVRNIATLGNYNESSVIFSIHAPKLTNPVACLISTTPDPLAQACIIVSDPKKAMRLLLNCLELPSRNTSLKGVHPTAIVSPKANLGHHVTIGPHAVVEDHCHIGDHSVIGPNVHLMHHASLGHHCQVASGTVIYPYVSSGSHVHIGANAVLGDAGFGYDWDGNWVMFPQIGRLVIEDDVHIGPLSVIDRGAIHDTVIGKGCKLDAKMMIGHGVTIGRNVIMAACGAVGGSSSIGEMTVAGGCVQISDHVAIAPGTRLAGGASVAQSVRKEGEYASGLPLMSATQWRRWLRFVLRTINPQPTA